MISQWELLWYCYFPAGSPVRWCGVGVGRQIPFECMKKTWCWNFIVVGEYILEAWYSFFARSELPFKTNTGFVQNRILSLVWMYQHLISANSEGPAGSTETPGSTRGWWPCCFRFCVSRGCQPARPGLQERQQQQQHSWDFLTQIARL